MVECCALAEPEFIERGLHHSDRDDLALGLGPVCPLGDRQAPVRFQSLLEEEGADYSKGLPLRPRIVTDRALYTGQNPQSSEELGKKLIADLGA